MRQAYPEIRPFARGHWSINGQSMYVEQAGQPNGIALLYLHDGPGLGCHRADRRLFDPNRYHLILPDQRGCGRSQPHLSLTGNNRQAVCDDLLALQTQLGIDRWVIAGAGWGGLVALTMAIAAPTSVRALLLIGTSLGSAQELDWQFEQGAPQVFPEAYRQLCKALGVAAGVSGKALVARAHELLSQGNELERMAVARQWAHWLAHCAGLKPQGELQKEYLEPPVVLAQATLQTAFMMRQWDCEHDLGIQSLAAVADIATTCVHGRFDMVAPIAQVLALQDVLPDLKLHIVREAGHSMREAPMVDAIVKAQSEIADCCGAMPLDCG
ncbi:alpha/beta fold hydrolase [Simiduia curdlanivorans]|uniref:Proline iminopeptidase n=1 Tax=Simiduia curdlanivorans TaxID=1492769 RepID=A0ABV8V2A9_9GAMM|nr:alpha/beta fold hydrolase [Simiduia curdlanivorans]MDN3637322.1 alpha/beta fold hydrolase [Simiduia curdlanivorans]